MGLARLALILGLGVGAVAQSGYAARYAPGVMQRVARVRHIPAEPCMVALTSARRITGGQHVLVVGKRTGTARWCVVVDLPQDRDRKALEQRKIVVELDRESAQAICGSVMEGPRQCPVLVWEEDLWISR